MVRNTADLRAFLLDTMEQVRNGEIDHNKAGAISSLAGKTIQSKRLDMEAAKNKAMGHAPKKFIKNLRLRGSGETPSQKL